MNGRCISRDDERGVIGKEECDPDLLLVAGRPSTTLKWMISYKDGWRYPWTKGRDCKLVIPSFQPTLDVNSGRNESQENDRGVIDPELICYVHFSFSGQRDAEDLSGNFQVQAPDLRILWLMKRTLSESSEEDQPGSENNRKIVWRSVEFRSTMRYFWIPENGVDFFTLFVTGVTEQWASIFSQAKTHLSKRVYTLYRG